MSATILFSTHRLSRHPLAAGIAVACVLLATPLAGLANDWPVSNCTDAGAGSLRATILNHAHDGDTIHLESLDCSTITLTSGPIQIDEDNLTLTGPGSAALTIVPGSSVPGSVPTFSVLRHTGTGTLRVSGLTVSNPDSVFDGDHYGGCITSHGNVYLTDVVLAQCVMTIAGVNGDSYSGGGAIHADGDLTLIDSSVRDSAIRVPNRLRGWANGGGISVGGNLTLTGSTVSGNDIALDTPLAGTAHGGGIMVAGNLTASDSVIEGNKLDSIYSRESSGGGVWVGGNTSLTRTRISNNKCHTGATSDGGGIHAEGNLTLAGSVVSGNVCASGIHAIGGGIRVLGTLSMTDTLVSGNASESATASAYAGGGGIWADGPFAIHGSTIANNTAELGAGAVFFDSTTGHQRLISNSTVASNQSLTMPAGIYSISPLTINNSTIARNTSSEAFTGTGGAGLRTLIGTITMNSTIVADNSTDGLPADIDATVTGADNLIYAPRESTVPSDTFVGVPAGLGQLGDHGGPTPTINLLESSDAINHGSNPDALAHDQRGTSFARVVGFAADIGAFEFSDDVIFANGFEP